ncbi:MAG: NAD+ synthase [Burkholderiaceae bacterium]|nr:MAG: NAD+ synthase [Burkholderiaceae bacterium]
MKIAIAQINCTVGDLAGNAQRILEQARLAAEQGADILLTPELSLTGYPPEDLLLRNGFYEQCQTTLKQLADALRDLDLHVIVGVPVQRTIGCAVTGRPVRHNAAAVLYRGQITGEYHKHELPNTAVFDEVRYFTPGNKPLVFECKGVKFGLNICEDGWLPNAADAAKHAGAQILLVLNASPYHLDKQQERIEIMRARVQETGLPLVYANLVGGQDELVFDGASFALDTHGELCVQLPQFEEALGWVEIDNGALQPGKKVVTEKLEAQVYKALVLGVRDYLGKNGFPGAIIGLSGGVDSALTLAVAVDALGADKVRAVMMPSQYTADISWIDARAMVKILGVRYEEISITPMFDSFLAALADDFKGLPVDATEENIQARIRGTLLMALSNKTGSIVLTTGNKSEMATGYCTLYGDMAGGFAVIKDIYKTLVYRLCAYRNAIAPVIPERIITRPPSAELRPDQKDQDSLPPYEVLDAIVQRYMEEDQSAATIIQAGYPAADVERVVRLIKLNEYKRRQAPVGIRVSPRGFGRDWRYPITSKFRDD